MTIHQYNHLNKIFEEDRMWQDYDSDKSILTKAGDIANLIPHDVQSLLDVGCGNGIITNYLADRIPDVVGVDLSESALREVKAKTVVSSSDQLPFEDNYFDMVFSSQLLEHLPAESLNLTIKHFKRVSNRYILVTVPYKEVLRSRYVKCPACGKEFHAYHHLNTFSRKKMNKLFFPEFEPLGYYTGGNHVRRGCAPVLKIRQRVFGQYFTAERITQCYYCGSNRQEEYGSSIFTKMLNGINALLSRPRPFWFGVLYKKKQLK